MKDRQLNNLKEQLNQNLKDIKGRLHEESYVETTELSNYDNHPADNASDLTDQNTEMAIEQHKEEEIGQIETALQAIEDGTYGKCEVCGESISYERLEALPTALTCIEHANQVSYTESRPAEESILGSSTEQPIKKVEKIRDYQNSFEDVEGFGSSDSPSDAKMQDQKDFYKD